jgi:hypothetical protein
VNREERKKRRRERAERRARRLAERGEVPPLATFPPNEDPLMVYDRDGNGCGHVLRDLWARSAGFLVCGGPSLQTYNLDRLKDRGITSLGVNNAAGAAHCRAFTCSDPPMKFHHGIWLDPSVMKIVPKPKLHKRVRAKLGHSFRYTALNVNQCPNVWGYARNATFEPAEFLTSSHATWGVNSAAAEKSGRAKILFTWFLGLRLLHYLGVKRVYLLGVDFQMEAGAPYAWRERKDEGGCGGNNNHYLKARSMCRELLPVFQAAGFEVFNCNPESRLEVFPYIPFETALDDCRGHIPEEPFDLFGWYGKTADDGERGDNLDD